MNSTENMGNRTYSTYYQEPLALKYTKLTIEIALALLGVLGNLLVVIVITKRANMKTTMNLYLRNLAIADLGVLLVNFPLNAVARNTITYPFGKYFCLFIAPATEIFFGASIWSITVIAIERYRNIISRRSFGKRAESFKRLTLKILAIWLISFLVVAVPMYPYMMYLDDGISSLCYPVWEETTLISYTVGLSIFWYLLPLGIISFTYVKISRRLVQSNQFHKDMHGDDFTKSKLIRQLENQRLKQNKKAQRILTPLVAVFAVSMLPLTAFRLTFALYPQFINYKFYNVLFSVCAFFVIVNSVADPIVYYLSSKEFRKVLEAYLCKRESPSSESTTLPTSHAETMASQTMHTVVQTKI